MKEKHAVTIVVAVIGLIGTIGGSYCSAKWGQSNFEITVNTANGNDVEINKKNLEMLVSKNEELKAENSDYKSIIDKLESENKELSKKLDNANGELNDFPAVEYQNLGLSIDGEERLIDKSKSCAIIDGTRYFSNNFVNSFLDENESVTIKDNTMYVGKITSEQEFLSDQRVINSKNVTSKVHLIDTYGNNYADAFSFRNHSEIIINLDEKFSMLRAKIASIYLVINNCEHLPFCV